MNSDKYLLLPCGVLRCWIVTKLPFIYPLSLYIGGYDGYGTQEYSFFFEKCVNVCSNLSQFLEKFLMLWS